MDINSGKTNLVLEGTGSPEAVEKTIFFIDDGRSDGIVKRDGFKQGTFKSYNTETGKIDSYGDTVFHTLLFNGSNQYIYVYTKPNQNFNTPEADLYRLDLQTNKLEKSIHTVL